MVFIHKKYTNTAILLCLTLLLAQTASAQFSGRLWSEFPGGAEAACANDDIDDDNDGLIELCYLEDLNAMRYVPDGSGYQSSATATIVTTGCGGGDGNDTCFGYELVRDLDFRDDDSYMSAATNKAEWTRGKWRPIGGSRSNRFAGIFEGNGHTISNLTIKRLGTNNIGCFGYAGSSSRISNIGLLNVNIRGFENVGGLVGWNSGGRIENSYATGSVQGNEDVGGLVGENGGSVTNSYATGSVDGRTYAGGLVGWNNGGSIANSYATGFVNGIALIGGLVGLNSGGRIENSYATGFVEGADDIGGLVSVNSGSITNSYWDTEASEISISGGGTSKTTAELQSPTTATGIYSEWSTDNWDFGTAEQYPAIKYAHACGTSQQPACGTLPGKQRNNQPYITFPTTNTEILITVDANTTRTISVAVADDDVGDNLTLLLSVVDEDQNLVLLETTKAGVMPNGNADRAINEDLRIRVPQDIMPGTTTLQLVAEDDSGFGNAMSEPVSFKLTVEVNIAPMIDAISQVAVNEGATVAINPTVRDANDDRLTYTWRVFSGNSNPSILASVPKNNKQLRFNVPADWIEDTADDSAQKTLELEVKVSDGSLSTTETATVLVTKINNDRVDIPSITVAQNNPDLFTLGQIDLGDDADGVNAASNLNYQWQRCLASADCSTASNWQDVGSLITDPANRSLSVPSSLRSEGNEFRVKITYTDGQGYDESLFSRTRTYRTNPAVSVRTKVFLEGTLR